VLLAGKGKEDEGTVWRLSGEDEDGRGPQLCSGRANTEGPGDGGFSVGWERVLLRGSAGFLFFFVRGGCVRLLG